MIWNFDDPVEIGLITLTGSAQITNTFVPFSAPNCLYLYGRNAALPAGPAGSKAAWFADLTPGREWPIRMRVNGIGRHGVVALTVTLTDDSGSTSFTLDERRDHGWTLWEPGAFTPTSSPTLIEVAVAAPLGHPQGSEGYWLVDAFHLPDPVEAAILASKLAAMNALRDAIVGIAPANGYRTDLGSRVHRAVIMPDDEHVDAKMPFACLIEGDEDVAHVENFFQVDWDVVVAFYVAETWADKFNSSAVIDADNLADDIKKLVLENVKLSGAVDLFSLVAFSPGTAGALPESEWAEIRATFRLRQYVTLDSLAAA